jgi:hypothetical protein
MVIYVMMMLYFLWCILCECQFIISYFHSLSKVFHYTFLVTMRKVEIFEACPVRDRVGKRVMRLIIS